MAQNISLLGATYLAVPAVELPKDGGGTASFTDVTDTTATASDVASGKYFYTSAGVRTEGTAQGGSGDGYVWQDQDGYVHLSDEEGTGIIVDSLTVNGAGTYTAPTKHAYSPVTVPSGSAATPATSVTANPSISVSNSGLITATASATQSVTPTVSAGWVSSGTAGTVTVSGSNTSQLSTQAATTITPTTSAQTAVAAGKYTTGAVTVAAMPTGTAGTPTATKGAVSNHSVTVTPSVTNIAGYISGGTNTGTGVTVSASELVSGSETKTQNGTYDVTNLAEVVVNVSGGGGGDSWSWMGKNPTKVETFADVKTYLANTGYASWTPSTTAYTLQTATNYTGYSANTAYDYVALYRFHTHYEYDSQPNASLNDYYFTGAYFIAAVYSNAASVTSGTADGYVGLAEGTRNMMVYKNSSGTENSISINPGSGIYGVAQATISATTISGTTITVRSPGIQARCVSTYFSTTAAEAVNQNTSFYEYTVELWRVDRGTTPIGYYADELRDMWLNGF